MYRCSCCGGRCATEDPGQDKGYGFCDDCQEWMGARANTQLDDLAVKIEAALNPANRAKYQSMSAEKRRDIAAAAIDEGLVTFSIGRSTV